MVEEWKTKIVEDDKEYLLEKPLRALMSTLPKKFDVETLDNVYNNGTTKDFRTIMPWPLNL